MSKRQSYRLWTPTFNFTESPTLGKFLVNNSHVRIVVGPIGSGKTLACCFEVFRRALRQEPAHDGIRYFKCAVVRNTVPELKTTTLETWLSVFPEDKVGRFIKTGPMYHLIEQKPYKWDYGQPPERQAPDAEPGMKLRVDFFGLDNESDVKRLMSYEASMFFFNELRFIPRTIFKTATDRVGRYPSIQKGGIFPTWDGVIADTNPPDKDHWIYKIDKESPVEGWKIWHQPMAVLEAKEEIREDGPIWISTEKDFPDVSTRAPSRVQYSAKRFWIANPKAENLFWVNKHDPITKKYLIDPLGKKGYYLQRVAGAEHDWISVMYQAKYGALKEGKPVMSEFDRDLMVSDKIDVIPHVPITGGLDCGAGTLHSAAVLGQRLRGGLWIIHDEVAGLEAGLIQFAEELKARLMNLTKRATVTVGNIWGDPAGLVRDGVYEHTTFQHLGAQGITAAACDTNDLRTRLDATRAPMLRLVDKKPGIIIHPRCEMLIKGLHGAWQYRRLQIKGTERHMETPDKSEYSHVCEALGYMLLGGGEGRSLSRDSEKRHEPVVADTDFGVW